MNILVISDYRDYHTSRPEAYIFIELAKKGYNIHVMSFENSQLKDEFVSNGVTYVRFHPQKKFDKKEIEFIRNYVLQNKIDVVHLFNSKAMLNGIKAVAPIKKTKIVLYRGYVKDIYWYDPSMYLKYFHPRVDKIICNSKGVEELFHKQLFFNKNKTITICKGHNVNWYSNYSRLDIRKELDIDNDSFLLVNVANNRPFKGISYLLKAFNLLNNNKIHLLLIGKNMDSDENISIINKGKFKENVHLLGFRKDVLNIVANCDVFALSSISGESITKSVIESMSLNVAPIISNIPGNKELIEDGVSGLFFKTKNVNDLSKKIMDLYINKDWLNTIKKNAKLHIQNHLNIENTVSKYIEMYQSF